MRRKTATWIASSVVCVAALASVMAFRAATRDPIARLARMTPAHRGIEARFCGFRWAPLSLRSSRSANRARRRK